MGVGGEWVCLRVLVKLMRVGWRRFVFFFLFESFVVCFVESCSKCM